MATYRYRIIRRDIYEGCSNRAPAKFRTFSDMRKIFKTGYWMLLAGMILCLIASVDLFFHFLGTFHGAIPLLIELVLSIISEIFGYRMCNPSELKKEHDEVNASLESYIELIQTILVKHGITTKVQRDTLKKECEQELSLHNKYYQAANSNIFNVFIIGPLTALVTVLLSKNEGTNITINSIPLIIIAGLLIIGVTNIIKKIAFYSDGHFKDQYLLEILNELDYLPE